MRGKLWIALPLALLLAVCVAGYAGGLRAQRLTLAIGADGTNYLHAVTNKTLRGWIESVELDMPVAAMTGKVEVVLAPSISTLAQVKVYTNDAVTGDIIVRPRVDATDNAGTALTGDPPVRYAAVGDSVIFSITNSGPATSVVVNCIIKYESY